MKTNMPQMEMEERKEPRFASFSDGVQEAGILMGIERIDVKGKSANRYTCLDVESGDLFQFLGTAQLDVKLRPSDKGKFIIVTCTGTDPNVVRNGNAMLTFRVQVSKQQQMNAESLGISDADIPF